MSIDLNSALSGLSLSLQSEVASEAQLRELESLLLLAHQSKLRAALQSIQSEAEVQFAAANAALARAQEEAQAIAKAEFAQAQAEAEAALAAAVALRVEALAQESASQESASQESASPVSAHQETASQEPAQLEPIEEPVADSVQETPYELEQESATLSMQTPPEPTPSAPAASEQPRGPQRSVNSSYASLNAGLNDRLAFVKSLFGGDDHDYQRVVAYLSTLESKSECETFIVEALQPEYDWSACPDVAERFLKLVYARFD